MTPAEKIIINILEHQKGERLIWDPIHPYKDDNLEIKNQYWQKNDIDWPLHFSGELKQGGRLSDANGASKARVVDLDRSKKTGSLFSDPKIDEQRKEEGKTEYQKVCEDTWKIDNKLFPFRSPGGAFHIYEFYHCPLPTKDSAKRATELERAFKKLKYNVDSSHTLPKQNGSQTGINFPFHTHQQPYDPRGNAMTKEQFIHAFKFQNFPLIKAATNMKTGEGGRPPTLLKIAALLEQNNLFNHLDEVIENFGDKFSDAKYIKRIKDEGIHKKYIDIGTGKGDGLSIAISEIVGFEYEYKESFPEPPANQTEEATAYEGLTFPQGNAKILEGKSVIESSGLEKIAKDYCYVMANDMFNELGTSEFYQSQQLNNFHKHLMKKGSLTDLLLKHPKFNKATTFITSAKFKPGLINITKPGMIPLINKGVVLNIYIPNYLTAKEGDVKFLIDFFIWLIGIEKWKIIEQWIAYNMQYPSEKIKWAVVLVSVIEGTGKGLLARIISRILGIDNVNENANYKHLTNTHNTLLVGTQVLVLNEVSLGDFKSKNEGTNTLKNFVADDYYSCNFKNKPMVKLANLTNFMLFSNDITVLGVANGARRYFFCNITRSEKEIIKITNEDFFKKAWNFVDSDAGAAALIHYFKKEVKITKPEMFKARAPITEDLKELIEQSKHPLQKKLEHDLTRPDLINRKIFKYNWCGLITFDELNDALSTTSKDDTEQFKWGSYGDDAIYKFLAANSSVWNNGGNTRQININGVKHRFHLLDDSKCPLPEKSYKDLTPKQIETIYDDYLSVKSEIEDEEPNYIYARDNIEDRIRDYKTSIDLWRDLKTRNKKHFKAKTVDQIYEEIMNGSIEVEGNEKHEKDYIKLLETRLKRGIRKPDQILEERMKKDPTHKRSAPHKPSFNL